ncbi:MAG: FkbM family methyltransferase [Methylotenera sp.]|nr:FkbM family methyltransferase [Methylotenera sp.]
MSNPSRWFLPKKIRKTLTSFINSSVCSKTGFLYQTVGEYRVYLRRRSEYLSVDSLNKLCTHYYYKFYMPKKDDVVVCVGAGLGHEAVWLADKMEGIRYVGVEIQPYLYELLSNTFNQINRFQACGRAINNSNQHFLLHSAIDYTAVATDEKGYIEVDSIIWSDFLSKYQLTNIDLLQINIEGAEKYLLPMIENFSNIKRIIVSAHDFRANRGDGEHFRTREFVKNYLIAAGYTVTHCGSKPRQMDWMFAERH